MTSPKEEPLNAADLRGPGDPDEAAGQQAGDGQQADDWQEAGNIREEQQTQAAGTVPASYVGSGDPGAEHKPEDAVREPGTWDDEV
ncbi:hypothetical protein [Arthrobacter sp. B6]|uniref:hypothetical protein n=1 Tax=Arthrobacter sp. B6 TaxID=1570137 RepID=UPI00082D01DA|nr:hypothetical protein [Arthrobacter sp. B6]